jgi:hypothetical protein
MLQSYNESCLKSSFRKFYGRYDDRVCNYKISLSHMLNIFTIQGLRSAPLYLQRSGS